MSKLMDCLLNHSTKNTPVWFMRQAGRYLPEFMKIRQNNKDFIKLCLNSNLAKEITIQPINRFNLDAAIIFSDILMIPYGLGQIVKFEKGYGPMLEKFNLNEILNFNEKRFFNNLSPVYEAIKKVKKEINEKSVIGFVGAPWTLLLYMLNGHSPKRDFNFNEINKNKKVIKDLLLLLEKAICVHIKKQVDAGADVIQVFDSWAGLLPTSELNKFCYQPTSKIVSYTKSLNIPVICFPRGIKKNYLNFCNEAKPTCLSIDYEINPNWIKDNIKNTVIQGGLDPKILLKNNEQIKNEVIKYLDLFCDQPYIFNLGHGVLPETKPETIEFVTRLVKEYK